MDSGNSQSNLDKYWADYSNTEDDYVRNVNKKVEDYSLWYRSSGLFDLDRTSYACIYGLSPDGGAVSFSVTQSGQNGQITKVMANHYANIRNHISSLITSRKPTLDAKASNGDSASLEDAKIGNMVLEHFIRQLGMEAASRELVKMSLDTREGFLWLQWDADSGDTYVRDEFGSPIKTGSPRQSVHMGQDVIRDVTDLSAREPAWYILRDFVNRYDLMAEYPEFEEEIAAVQTQRDWGYYRVEFKTFGVDTDFIPVYRVFHTPTKAVPEGRWSLVCGDTLLLDGEAGYGGKMPLLLLRPDSIRGTPFGHTPMYDLLGLQVILNALISGTVTNEIAFAVKRLLLARGQPITSKQLSTELGVIQYDPSKPTPTMMEVKLETGERLEAIQYVTQLFETLSAVNAVVRGNTEGVGTDAASGLALLQTQALQYFTDLSFQYADFWRKWGELLLSMVHERADMPILVSIVGEDRKTDLKRISKETLSESYHVQVDLGDPSMRTASARLSQAQFMAVNGLLGEGPEASANYLEVLSTGTLDPIIDEKTAEKDLIHRENEKLMEGVDPGVSEYDTPAYHMQGHAVVAYSQGAREELTAENGYMVQLQAFTHGLGQLPPGFDPSMHPLAPKRPKSPIMDALRQHMQEHRKAQLEMAQIQDAQAAQLVQIQAALAPQPQLPAGPPGPPQGQPGPSGGNSAPPPAKNPRANPDQDLSQTGKLPPTPPNAAPVPGVQT